MSSATARERLSYRQRAAATDLLRRGRGANHRGWGGVGGGAWRCQTMNQSPTRSSFQVGLLYSRMDTAARKRVSARKGRGSRRGGEGGGTGEEEGGKGREGGREGGMEGWRERKREGGREGGRARKSEGESEEGEGESEEGSEEGSEGERERNWDTDRAPDAARQR